MPRPRRNLDELLVRELRITPPDGKPIDTEGIIADPSIKQFVAFAEGGDNKKRLHYHCLIETTMCQSQLVKWIYTVARALEGGEKGNAVFFSRKPHEFTEQYIAKANHLLIRKGYDQTTLDDWFKRSQNYQAEIRQNIRTRQENRASELKMVTDIVIKEEEAQIKERGRGQPYARVIVKRFIETCYAHGFAFPTRTQLDAIVIRIMYKYEPEAVYTYYGRTFDGLMY
jgi:hypothetical protein